MRHAHAQETVERRERVEAPQQAPEVERGPQRGGDADAVDDHDVVARQRADATRHLGATYPRPRAAEHAQGWRRVHRRARQDVHPVQPGSGPVGDDRRLGNDEPQCGRAQVDGVPHLHRDVGAAQHRADQRAVEQQAQVPPGHSQREGLLGREGRPQRERTALVEQGEVRREPARRRSHAADGARRGTTLQASSTGTTYAVPQTARSAPGQCRQVPGQHLESAPNCPVSTRRVPRTARSAPGECPELPGQKMMSPDLRRERRSWRASSRMSAASLSERRSFT